MKLHHISFPRADLKSIVTWHSVNFSVSPREMFPPSATRRTRPNAVVPSARELYPWNVKTLGLLVFIARRYAVARCLSVSQSVSPSVRPPVTFVYCIQTAEDIVKLHSEPGSPITLVFLLRGSNQIQRGTPSARGAKYTGWENFATLDWNRRLSQRRHSTDPWLLADINIGSQWWRINTCRFQRPWVNPNAGFKVIAYLRVYMPKCVLGTKLLIVY